MSLSLYNHKGLDLIECLKNYGQRFVTLYRAVIKIIPKKKKCKKAKWLSKEALQIAEKKKKEKNVKGKGEVYSFLTCIQISQEAGEMVWYSHLFKSFPQFVVIHTVKSLSVINEAEVDVFLELPCFFDDPTDVGNLISGSSAFSKTSLNIWKFMVHILLKPGLENFEHYFAGV